MRIVSGTYKGRRITAPKKLPVRPTTDMAKESLFNILNNHFYFDELRVLELFAGTGNISYEFASRGCPDIVAVDADMGCVRFINQTSNELEMGIRALKQDVFTFLEKNREQYNLIFADPPYAMEQELFERLVQLVFERGLLAPEGQLVVEHSKQSSLEHLPQFLSQRKYGGTSFSFFGHPAEEE